MAHLHKPRSIGGVPDFDEKIELCLNLLGARTNRELVVEKVITRAQDRTTAERLAARMHRWREHYPSNNESHMFWNGLAAALHCDESISSKMLIEASIEQFVDYIGDELQAKIRHSSPKERHKPTINHYHYPPVFLAETGPVETIATGFKHGRIDQKHYYLDPDAARSWSSLVRAEGYPSYDHCKTALQALVDSQQWGHELMMSQPLAIVMLAGGGAPTKDLLLLRNLLSQPHVQNHVEYFLVDISFYMLRDSALWIHEYGDTIDGFEKVKLESLHRDVLKLTERHRDEFHQTGTAIFAITGGTIGNISEAQFFKSLNRASRAGDLLVIAADTLDSVPSTDVERALASKYNHNEFHQWIRPVVRAVTSESKTHEHVQHALERVTVTLRPAGEAHASDIPGSWSIILTLEIDDRDITLLSSTRYQSTKLVEFAATFGWEILHQAESPLNSHFKQFLFKRKAPECNGNN